MVMNDWLVSTPQSRWSLLRLSPQSQSRFVRLMGEYCQGVEYYFPVYECEVRPHGSRRAVRVVRPVYPGYIFVKGSDTRMVLASLPVRVSWVRFGGVIEYVNDRVIKMLKELESGGELVREVKNENPYRVGVRVYIHMDVGDLVGVICKMVGGTRALVDLPVGRGSVPVHCLEPV